jgi:tetratricopeptide (TPR) repeat protein
MSSGGYLSIAATAAVAALSLGCVGGACTAAPDAAPAEAAAAAAAAAAAPVSKEGAASGAAAASTPSAPTPISQEPGAGAETDAPDIRLDSDTRQKMNAVDAQIDALELEEATASLEALVAELKPQPQKVHGCIQAMDVLGQCYIMNRKLKQALQTYEELIQMVEASPALSESGLYIAGYAIRGGLHEKIGGMDCEALRDADYAKATAGGAPEGYGREIVDQFFDKHKHYKEKKKTGRVPTAWVADRRQYKVGHKIGEANQLIIAKRFDEAADLITAAIAGALEDGENRASPGVLAFKCIRAQAYIGLCKLDEAIADFSTVIDNTNSDPSYLADPANQESVVQYVEALLDRGGLRHFLSLGEALVRDDWERASKAMPSVDVSQHVTQLLGEWVQLDSWRKLPKARKLVALNLASKVRQRANSSHLISC